MTVSDVSLMQVSARKLAAGAHTISVQAKQRAELMEISTLQTPV